MKESRGGFSNFNNKYISILKDFDFQYLYLHTFLDNTTTTYTICEWLW